MLQTMKQTRSRMPFVLKAQGRRLGQRLKVHQLAFHALLRKQGFGIHEEQTIREE